MWREVAPVVQWSLGPFRLDAGRTGVGTERVYFGVSIQPTFWFL